MTAAIPPVCRRPIEPAPAAILDGSDLVVQLGPWRPRVPARHFVPAVSLFGRGDYALRFELSAHTGGEWSPWVATATLGYAEFFSSPSANGIASHIDLWTSEQPLSEIRLRLRLRAADPGALLAEPWLVTLSASDGGTATASQPGNPTARLSVPALSQMQADATIAGRICSPTSMAMVLEYMGSSVSVEQLAGEMFHPGLDIYGVWPAAVCAAARRRVPGYLLRFPDWASAAWCLDQGLPIIASVRYEAGELMGAAIAATPGHLIVIVGYEGGDVLVNDPAAPTVETVPRRYSLADLERVWLGRAGVGYVFFKAPSDSAPPRPGTR